MRKKKITVPDYIRNAVEDRAHEVGWDKGIDFVEEKKSTGATWFKMFEKNFIMAAERLSPPAFSFLFRLMPLARVDNYIFLNSGGIADRFGMKRRRVQQLIKELEYYKLIIRERPYVDMSGCIYRINPQLYYKPKIDKWKAEVSKLSKDNYINWNPNGKFKQRKEEEIQVLAPNAG